MVLMIIIINIMILIMIIIMIMMIQFILIIMIITHIMMLLLSYHISYRPSTPRLPAVSCEPDYSCAIFAIISTGCVSRDHEISTIRFRSHFGSSLRSSEPPSRLPSPVPVQSPR